MAGKALLKFLCVLFQLHQVACCSVHKHATCFSPGYEFLGLSHFAGDTHVLQRHDLPS